MFQPLLEGKTVFVLFFLIIFLLRVISKTCSIHF